MDAEAARLAALDALGVLDTPPTAALDALARLAAFVSGTPGALVNLLAAGRQFFKARHGCDLAEPPLQESICHRVFRQADLTVIPDTAADARVSDSALVTAHGVRFYAGAALLTPEGHRVGTLCVFDTAPRDLSPEQRDALATLGRQVVAQLLLGRQVRELEEAAAARERAILAQWESEERFRAFIEHSPAVSFLKDADGRFVFVSPSLPRTFGNTAADWLGKTDFDLHAPDVAADLRATDVGILASGRTTELYETVPTPDGQSYHWQVYKFRVTDAAGRHFLGGMAVDRTAEKQAADELVQSEERFRGVVDRLAEGVFLIDLHTRRVVRANDAACGLLGYTPAEIGELSQYDFVAHDPADIDAHMMRVLTLGRHHLGERKYRRKSGAVVDVNVSGSLVTAGGRPVLCLVVRSIAEQKRYEAVLLGYQKELEQANARLQYQAGADGADRHPQPGRLPGAVRRRVRPPRPGRPAAQPADPGRGPLQGVQRHLRPPGRGRRPAAGGPHADHGRAGDRLHRPVRRRGVRRHPARHRRRRGGGPGRPGAAGRPGRGVGQAGGDGVGRGCHGRPARPRRQLGHPAGRRRPGAVPGQAAGPQPHRPRQRGHPHAGGTGVARHHVS